MNEIMLSQFQHHSEKWWWSFLTTVPASETVSVAPQKGDEGEEGVTSEGTFCLVFFPAFPPFSHAHLCVCHSTFFQSLLFRPSPCQSLTSSWRREPKLPRWRPPVVSRVRRREPRSARSRRGRTSRCWPCRTPASSVQHDWGRTDVTPKHPPPFWNITTLFIFTLQKFIHNLLCKKEN